MNILLTNNHLVNVGGSETWIRTMANELKKNHNVVIYTKNLGYFSNLLEKEGLVVINDLNALEVNFELVIANHTTTLADIKNSNIKCPIIFTSHSFFVNIERPVVGADHYVAVTEECADTNFPTTIIRNGIDIDKFSEIKPNNKLQNILYLTHPWNKFGIDLVKDACKDYNLRTIDQPIFDIEKEIQWADLVITIGRGILESLACGKNVISGDHREWTNGFIGAGIITEDNFDALKTHALSGRNYPKYFTAETLRYELDKYNSERNLRHKIEEEYNIKKTTQQYLNLK